MTEEEFLALETLIREKFEEIGAPELGAEGNLVAREDKSEARGLVVADDEPTLRRLLDPRSRVVEMLRAFSRHLAIQDQQTYRKSLTQIRDLVSGENLPQDVIVLPFATDVESSVRPAERALASAPDLVPLRREIDTLIAQIIDTPYEREPPTEGT